MKLRKIIIKLRQMLRRRQRFFPQDRELETILQSVQRDFGP